MQDISKVIVACPYCGIANLFSNGTCVRCGGILKIELAITDERLEEIKERSEALDERELNISTRLTFIEQEKDKLKKRETQLELMKTITDSFKSNRTKYILIAFGCVILGLISFVITGYAISYVSSLPSIPISIPVTNNDSVVSSIDDFMLTMIPLFLIIILLSSFMRIGKRRRLSDTEKFI